MAGRNMVVSVLVKMIDGLTSPLRGMMRGIGSIGSGIANVGRQIGLIGGTLAALSFASPIQQAAAWDASMRDIAITAGKTGGDVEDMIKRIGKQYETLALETGQRSNELAKGAQLLIAAGMDDKLIDQLMPTIGRVATAANAAVEDAAKTAFALSETLKINPEEMELAMAKLVTAGKLGRFEFNNMAKEFPGLTAQMAKLGVTGMEAVSFLGASLQTAMLGTDDPAQAANNLKNFLTKINAPDAIKKFQKELKVDVTGVMTDATAKGINPVEAVIQKMTEKLKVPKAEIDKIMKQAGKAGMSDKEAEKALRSRIEQLISGSKVGKLYADMQVLDFLIPMLLNKKKFMEMKEEIAKAGIDVIANDFASRMRGLSAQLMVFGEVGTQVMRRIGLAFASNLPAANAAMIALLQWVAQIDAKWPGLIDGILSWTGALLALGAGVAILTPVFSALAAVIGVLAAGFAALLSPVGIAAALIAAAAYYIWSNWADLGPKFGQLFEGLKTFFAGFGEWVAGVFTGDFHRAAEGASQMMTGLANAFSAGWDVAKSLFQAGVTGIDQLVTTWAQSFDRVFGTDIAGAYERMKVAAADAWASAIAKGSEFLTWVQELPGKLMAAGSAAIEGLWAGMRSKFDELIGWLQAKMAELGGLFKLPSFFGGGTAAPGGAKSAPAVDPMGNSLGGAFSPTSAPGGSIGGANGFTKTAAANSNVAVGGRIVVEAAEGTRIRNVESTNPAVPVTPNRGAVQGRA
jgi:TP901 family phage tail tape measure protein